MADVEIKGLSELLEKMKRLPGIINQKCLRRSMVPGAQKIRNTAKSNLSGVVKMKTGLLERAIRLAYNRKESTPGKAVYHVFVSSAVRGGGGTFAMGRKAIKKIRAKGFQGSSAWAFYWRFIELGTIKRPATPYMRTAFDSEVRPVIDLIKNKLAELIEKEASALGR